MKKLYIAKLPVYIAVWSVHVKMVIPVYCCETKWVLR